MIRTFKLAQVEPTKLILLSPVIFVLHVAEEAPGFVEWFNSLVTPDITQQTFMTVNLVAFIITCSMAAAVATTKTREATCLALTWLSFLFFANAILHIAGNAVHRRYSPGLVTATLLYLPYFFWFLRVSVSRFNLTAPLVLLSMILGSSLMLVHGYLIVFQGSRLF
jgi:hypothetical protein